MQNVLRHIAKLVTLQLLRAYKWAVSPLLPPLCRYVPTCSEYAMEAVERFGVLTGTWMAMLRVLRCHPFARGGYDPVVRECSDAVCATEPWRVTGDQRPTTAFRKA